MIPDPLYWKELGQLLRKERLQKQLTQAQVAQKLFIERSMISKIENGKARIPVLFMIEYCRLFDTSAGKVINSLEISHTQYAEVQL